MSVATLLAATSIPAQAQENMIYVAVEPCRLADTREEFGGSGVIPANTSRDFLVSGADLSSQGGASCVHPRAGIGVDPLAISAYIVAIPTATSGDGLLTAFPADQTDPDDSIATVNYAAGQVIGNTTNATLCENTAGCPDGPLGIITHNTEQDVVVDVQGYFYPETSNSEALESLNDLIGEGLEEQPPIGGGTQPNPLCDAKVLGTGPGGGLIFFVTEDRCKGLEVSKIDLNGGSSTQWGCDSTATGAYYKRLGNGYENTSLIIGAACTDGDDAADLAIAYVWPNNQTDGYLPDVNELLEIYNTIGPGGADLTQKGLYWTSTEDNDNTGNAFVLDFSTSNKLAPPKDTNAVVRAVRIFNLDP